MWTQWLLTACILEISENYHMRTFIRLIDWHYITLMASELDNLSIIIPLIFSLNLWEWQFSLCCRVWTDSTYQWQLSCEYNYWIGRLTLGKFFDFWIRHFVYFKPVSIVTKFKHVTILIWLQNLNWFHRPVRIIVMRELLLTLSADFR